MTNAGEQPPMVSAQVETTAKRLAEWIGHSWDGIGPRSACDRGIPEWSSGGTYQGGQPDLKRLAQELLSAAPSGGVVEDDVVMRVARAIAEHGIGRAWDDFLPCNAHDVDHHDLTEYARAALTAIRPAALTGEAK